MGLLGETIKSPQDVENVQNDTEKTNEETAVQESQETSSEATTETDEGVKNDSTTETTDEERFSLKSFNSTFGQSFEKEEDIKSLFEKIGEYDEVKSQVSSLKDRNSTLEAIAGKLDPMKWFASEGAYKREQLRLTKGNDLTETQLGVLSGIDPDKISDMSPKDMLKADLMVNKGLSGEEAEAYLSDEYGDFDGDDASNQAKVKIAALSAKDGIESWYKDIEIPEKVDYESSIKQLNETWKPAVDELAKAVDNLSVVEGFDFAVTDEMKTEAVQEVLSDLVNGGVKPSEETGQLAIGMLREKLLLNNLDNVFKSYAADLNEKFKEEHRKEVHNDTGVNNESRQSASSESNASKILKYLG